MFFLWNCSLRYDHAQYLQWFFAQETQFSVAVAFKSSTLCSKSSAWAHLNSEKYIKKNNLHFNTNRGSIRVSFDCESNSLLVEPQTDHLLHVSLLISKLATRKLLSNSRYLLVFERRKRCVVASGNFNFSSHLISWIIKRKQAWLILQRVFNRSIAWVSGTRTPTTLHLQLNAFLITSKDKLCAQINYIITNLSTWEN